MTSLTQPLRDEHRELRPQIEILQAIADSVGVIPATETIQRLDVILAFLTDHLLVHAQAEEQVLYPAVAKVLGTPDATATMRLDHVAIHRMTAEIQTFRHQLAGTRLTARDERDARRLLYGLHALVMVHLAKEEEVFLPILDAALDAVSAAALFSQMEQAAHALMDAKHA